MDCKVCKRQLDYKTDLPNIKIGDNTCMGCWHKQRHCYT